MNTKHTPTARLFPAFDLVTPEGFTKHCIRRELEGGDSEVVAELYDDGTESEGALAERLSECYNVCQEIAAPAEALAMARDALAEACKRLSVTDSYEELALCKDALRALGG